MTEATTRQTGAPTRGPTLAGTPTRPSTSTIGPSRRPAVRIRPSPPATCASCSPTTRRGRMAYARTTSERAALVALNVSGSSRTLTIPVRRLPPERGPTMRLGYAVGAPSTRAVRVSGGTITLTLPASARPTCIRTGSTWPARGPAPGRSRGGGQRPRAHLVGGGRCGRL